MSRARSPSSSVKSLADDETEVHRLEGGDLACAVETNDEQSLVVAASDDGRAVVVIDEPDVTAADAIEASYRLEEAIDCLNRTPFTGGDEV